MLLGIASYVRVHVASWLCTKLTKACVKCRCEQVSKASVARKPTIRTLVYLSVAIYM